MKKIFSLLLCAILVFSFFACSEKPISKKNTNELARATDAVTDEKTETKTEPLPFTEPVETDTDEPDTTEDDGRYYYKDISILLPTGFQLIETDGTPIAVPSDYPMHSDNIAFTYTADASGFANYSEDEFKAMFEEGFGVPFSYFKMETYQVDDYNVICFSYKMTMNGVELIQAQYAFLVGNHATHVTFTLMPNSEYLTIFDTASKTIRIED